MDCPVLKENERLKKEIEYLKQKHKEENDMIRQLLVDKKNEKEQ